MGRSCRNRQATSPGDVLLHGIEVERSERLSVVEILAERVGLHAVLAKRAEVQLFRPPELVRLGLAHRERRAGCRQRGCRHGKRHQKTYRSIAHMLNSLRHEFG
jgi:hypothetical protein